jgi:hydrophobic/amphiphilic exporter-1 (mainly G- bacteria), HAE1 family
MREGATALEAARRAAARRLRPIVMTSAAMVLGMLPTAVGGGVGSEFRAPMATAVIGGVISSTLLTLLVVPALFVSVERVRAMVASAAARRPRGAGAEVTSGGGERPVEEEGGAHALT